MREGFPVHSVSFSKTFHPVVSLMPSRRVFLLGMLAGAGIMAGYKITDTEAKPGLHPPGASPEKSFFACCLRCGQRMAACPTNALQHMISRQGLMGSLYLFFTPVA